MPWFGPRGVPWDPGPLRTNPNLYAAWLAYNGFDRSRIIRDISDAFPNLDPQQLGKLASQGERFRDVLSEFELGPPGDRISRQDIPRVRSIHEAYRFVATVVCEGKDAEGEELIDARTVVIDNRRNMTFGEVEGEAMRLYNLYFTGPQAGSPALFRDEEPVGPTACYVEMVSVARRT